MGDRFFEDPEIVVLQGFDVADRAGAQFHQPEARIRAADIAREVPDLSCHSPLAPNCHRTRL